MIKRINIKLTKLLKYYSLINYNLIYDNINNFKKDKKDIVKEHARFPTAFLCKGTKNGKY